MLSAVPTSRGTTLGVSDVAELLGRLRSGQVWTVWRCGRGAVGGWVPTSRGMTPGVSRRGGAAGQLPSVDEACEW
eukprot:110468-Chlamydomonas_euryale.AAC.3